VLRVAYRIAQRVMPAYSHPCSPKKFTQHQLFACLVLKECLKLDYRGVEVLLAEWDSLRAIVDLHVAPDFTTLQKACRRLLALPMCNRLLDETVRQAKRAKVVRSPVKHVAVDSSGFEAHRISNYYVRRRARNGKTTGKWHVTTYRRYPKLGMACDCSSHFLLAAVPDRGPRGDDRHWRRAMLDTRRRVRMSLVLCDAGYDAEWIHWDARLVFQTRSIIPPTRGRPSENLPTGYYRRKMTRLFQKRKKRKPYHQRSQAETVFSMIKRRIESSVNAYSYWSQCRALMLKALTHNIMILRRPQVFDRAGQESF
jgi:hypothetical protein